MLNQTIVVGRLVRDPEIKELEDNRKVGTITVAVNRTYKNENGEYDTDFITCELWAAIAENTVEYCHKGDLLGIKGRLQTREIEDEDGNKKYQLYIVADKITFLAQNK